MKSIVIRNQLTSISEDRLLNGKIARKMGEKSIDLSASGVRHNYCEERLRQDKIRCQNILLPFKIISARLGWAKTLATRNTMRAFFGLTKSVRRALFRNPTNSLVYMSRFSWMKVALSKWVQDLWVQLFRDLLFCLLPNKPQRECFVLSLERFTLRQKNTLKTKTGVLRNHL